MIKSLALGAILAVGLMASPVYAADLGGNCCADLEERIAELEATRAAKGNRKQSVVVYGQVNKGILWHNFSRKEGAQPEEGEPVSSKLNSFGVVDGPQSPTALGVRGEGKISPNWAAGYKVELGIDQDNNGGVYTRLAFGYIEGPVGRFALGKNFMATDGAGSISVANTAVAARMLSIAPLAGAVLPGVAVAGGAGFLHQDLPYDQVRGNVARWDSPVMSGFMLSASFLSGTGRSGVPAVELASTENQPDDAWDVALRYAGEMGGFKVAAGVGYRSESHMPQLSTALDVTHSNVFTGSASAMHVASGLFVNVGYGKGNNLKTGLIDLSDSMIPLSAGTTGDSAWHLQAGIEKNLLGFGNLTLFGEYAKLSVGDPRICPTAATAAQCTAFQAVSPVTVGGPSATMYGLGAVQAIDAAATDLYLSWRHYSLKDGTVTHPGDEGGPAVTEGGEKLSGDSFMGGLRIRF